MTAQAIPYWQAAGRRALQRSANREAANHATRGLELLATLPETPQRAKQELSLQLILGPSLSFVGRPSIRRAHLRPRPRAGARSRWHAGAIPCAFRTGLRTDGARAHARGAGLGGGIPGAGRATTRSARVGGGKFYGGLRRVVAGRFHRRARPQPTGPGAIQPRPAPRRHRGVQPESRDHLRILTALSNWVLGYPTQASLAMEQTLAHAKELQHPYSVGLTLLFSAQLFQLRREPGPALACAEEAIAVSAEHGLHAVELWCLLPRGWAAVQRGTWPQV